MEISNALDAFASLSQETRLRVFKLLVEYGNEGSMAGAIATELGIPDNTLSFHLSHLSRSGLVTSKKEGRSITYFARCDAIEELIGFLRENCCERETKPSKKSKSCSERKC